MRMPRFRFTVRRMMLAVAFAAVVLALETRGIRATVLLAGPAGGAMLQRWRGGRGVLGGAAGGCLSWTAYGIACYLPLWLGLGVGWYDYLGPAVTFGLVEAIGFANGSVIGTVIWLAADRPWLPFAADPLDPRGASGGL